MRYSPDVGQGFRIQGETPCSESQSAHEQHVAEEHRRKEQEAGPGGREHRSWWRRLLRRVA
jgi:hypothetical protein